jgi:aspartokinase
VFENRPTWHLLEEFSGAAGGGRPSGLRVDADVELIYFQGPHFGDRYGIADAAFGALFAADVPVLAAACTAASIYIALPKDTAGRACKALSESFVVPGQE